MLALLLLAACGPTSESFPQDYAEALCTRSQRCGEIEASGYDACVAEFTTEGDCSEDWSASLAADCLDWMETAECSASPHEAPGDACVLSNLATGCR